MGKKDIITKEYIDDPEVFADVFNYLLHGGKKIIEPENLRPLDTTIVATPYGTDGAVLPVKRVRDNLKCLTAMEDENSAYLLLGIENQSEIHYSMPVRDMLYDSLQYVKQVEEAIRSRKKQRGETDKSGEKVTTGEYLSGFHKDDKLIPVITLVIYFGSKKWDAPKRLHEMLAVQDEKILSFVPDYKINLIAPAEMSEKKIKRLSTDLREVMIAIKYEKNIRKLFEHVNHDPRFKDISRQAAQVINVMLGAKLKINQEEERCDMKESLKEWEERTRREGRKEGVEIGRKDGVEIGRQKEIISMAIRLLKQNKLSHVEIAEVSGLSVEEVERLDQERIA